MKDTSTYDTFANTFLRVNQIIVLVVMTHQAEAHTTYTVVLSVFSNKQLTKR